MKSKKSCGCFTMTERSSNIVFLHALKIHDLKTNTDIRIENYTSLQFDLLFLKKHLDKTVKLNKLELHDALDKIEDCEDNIIEYFNNNGYFTVYGWYRRGEREDKSSEDDTKIESGECVFHITLIHPTNELLINGREHNAMKIDTDNI